MNVFDLKPGNTVRVVNMRTLESRTGTIARLSDLMQPGQYGQEFEFEGEANVMWPLAWVVEASVLGLPLDEIDMPTCPTCHEAYDEDTYQLVFAGVMTLDADCLSCFHIHQFGKADVTSADYIAAGWDVPVWLTADGIDTAALGTAS